MAFFLKFFFLRPSAEGGKFQLQMWGGDRGPPPDNGGPWIPFPSPAHTYVPAPGLYVNGDLRPGFGGKAAELKEGGGVPPP